MRLSLTSLAAGLALVAIMWFGVLLPQQVHAATDCPTGSVKITPDQNASLFSSSPTAAYACSSTDGVTGTGASFTFFDTAGNQLKSDATVNPGVVAKTDENGKPVPQGSITCSGLTDFFFNAGTCIGRSLSAFIGTALLTVSAWLLQIAGLIFNWLMYYTVIAFGDSTNGFLTKGVLDAINTTWTAFRDISNIVIIGMFTFIAISIILGLNKFGSKKLIARVLIIAILINFSLLFTKMIIDFSNFTSTVFYNSSTGLTQTTPGAATDPFSQNGVAGQFIQFMGVTSVSDTFSAMRQGADNIDSGWLILLHGIFGSLLLLGAAVAFLYGSYLLLVRAVVLVFLLITSSFAFATYLIPKLSESGYGWSAWWKALFQNAIFAPLLMALLWATLILAKGLTPQSGTLGGLLTDATNTGNLSALFKYVIVLGFLVASLKVSSSFASSISGFNFTSLNIMRLAAAPVAIGSRFIAAPIMRNTLGRNSAQESRVLDSQISQEAARAARARAQNRPYDMKNLTNLMKQKESADKNAKKDFDLMNTKPGQALGKAVALPSMLAGEKKVGGFDGPRKKAAEEAIKKAQAATPSKEIVKEQAEAQVKEEQAPRRRELEQQQQAAASLVDAARATADAAKMSEKLDERRAAAEEHRIAEIQDVTKKKAEIESNYQKSEKTPESQRERQQQLREQDDRIKSANESVKRIDDRISDIENTHLAEPKRHLAEVQANLNKLDQELKARVQNATNDAMAKGVEVASDAAIELAHHPDNYTADLIRDGMKKEQKNKRLRERIKQEKAVEKEVLGEETPAAPAATHTPLTS